MSHTVHDLVQGSTEWLAYRKQHLNASEAAAMLGMSPYMTRSQLVKQKATGIIPEIDAHTQRRYDMGHEAEAKARPMAEELLGDDLYPITASRIVEGLPLSASFDGVPMSEMQFWENKWLNADLRKALAAAEIPEQYHPQLEQGLMVLGAEEALFTGSDGETMLHAFYRSNPALRARIIAGWKQFAADVAAYVTEAPEEMQPIAKKMGSLPALIVGMKGEITESNYDEWVAFARECIATVKTDLMTDQDFADADAAAKFCRESSKEMQSVKKRALSQVMSVQQMFEAIDTISSEFDAKGLQLEKLVKARKESRKVEIAQEGKDGLAAYLKTFEPRACYAYMPQITADFAAAIKGKSKFANMKDAVSVALTNAKMEANEVAALIEANLSALEKIAPNRMALFPDLCALVIKPLDDFKTLIEARVVKADADEKERVDRLAEQSRERIRLEEQAKAPTPAPAEKIAQDTGEITTDVPLTARRTHVNPRPATSVRESRDSLITKIVDLLEDYTDDELRNLHAQMTTAAAPF